MKKVVAIFLGLMILLAACGPRPAYKTREGKKKLRYYNDVQFGNPMPHKRPK